MRKIIYLKHFFSSVFTHFQFHSTFSHTFFSIIVFCGGNFIENRWNISFWYEFCVNSCENWFETRKNRIFLRILVKISGDSIYSFYPYRYQYRYQYHIDIDIVLISIDIDMGFWNRENRDIALAEINIDIDILEPISISISISTNISTNIFVLVIF